MRKKMIALPGDGIGPEIMESAISILSEIGNLFQHEFDISIEKIGGAAIDAHGAPLPDFVLDKCLSSDAVLLGAVGGPKWDNIPPDIRPERGLLRLRKELGLFANIRPVTAYKQLIGSSPLKQEIVEGVDFVFVRELTGGIYFGQPSERRGEDASIAVDTLVYSREEIERIVDKAFQLATIRRKKLTSVDKANVLESSRLWREIVEEKSKEYPDVTVEHMLVDSTAMQLIQNPKQFDVIVTENMFGDILSDEASVITGSLGMLPSASLRKDTFGLYEPIHGSAPDIAGQKKANPLSMILSTALMLRYSFQLEEEATLIETAVNQLLDKGIHTADLVLTGGTVVSTDECATQVIEIMKNIAQEAAVKN